jgi:pimeloyl-ACP methyl ester carboxylesterase
MSHFLADDGHRLHLTISGDGPPIVMLHGWTASHEEWAPFLPGLTPHHRVFRWDARGHGVESPLTPDADEATVQRMAQDLRNLIATYDLDDVVVVGHSMGALTLWQYLRDYGTANLAKICLIDQSPRLLTDDDWPYGIYGDFNRQRSSAFLNRLNTDFAEAVLELAAFGLNARARDKYEAGAEGWDKPRQWLQRLNPKPLVACWQSLIEADYRDVLEEIDIPALLVYGEHSNFYHVGTAHYVAERIPEAVLHIYEDTDHSPHQWQRQRFIRDLRDFIDG